MKKLALMFLAYCMVGCGYKDNQQNEKKPTFDWPVVPSSENSEQVVLDIYEYQTTNTLIRPQYWEGKLVALHTTVSSDRTIIRPVNKNEYQKKFIFNNVILTVNEVDKENGKWLITSSGEKYDLEIGKDFSQEEIVRVGFKLLSPYKLAGTLIFDQKKNELIFTENSGNRWVRKITEQETNRD